MVPVETNGAVAFQVQLNDGRIIRRYVHLCPDYGTAVETMSDCEVLENPEPS